MFFACIQHVLYMYLTCSLLVFYMFVACILNVRCMYLACSLLVFYLPLLVLFMYIACIVRVLVLTGMHAAVRWKAGSHVHGKPFAC